MQRISQKGFILASLLIIMIGSLVSTPKEASADPALSVDQCRYKRNCVGLLQNSQILVYRVDRGLNIVHMGTISNIGSGGGRLSYAAGWSMVTRDGFLDNLMMTRLSDNSVCQPWLDDIQCPSPGEGTVWLHPSDPAEDQAFVTCEMTSTVAYIDLYTCQAFHYNNSQLVEPSSITIGNDRVYAMNPNGYFGAHIWNWSPLYTNGGYAATFETSGGNKIRFWDDGSDGILFMNSGDTVLAKLLPLQDGNPNSFFTLPTGWGMGDMDVNTTYVAQAHAMGNDVVLMNIANNLATPDSTSIQVPVTGARNVALTADYLFAEQTSNPSSVEVFDMSGLHIGSINEAPSDVASFYPTDFQGCTNSATGLAEPGEACDGSDFDGITCQDYGFDGGQLSCSVTCDQIFTSGCWSCGDGTVNPGEQCDGSDMAGATCADESYANGTVSCTSSCTVDYSACYTCGNNVIEGPEQCEGADLQGNDCTTVGLGFMGGTLSCDTGACTWDTSQCHKCGNGVTDLDMNETCDGTDVPGDVCETEGYDGGTLGCNSTCDGLVDTNCSYCGDGQLDANEQCDLDQFQALTSCGDNGFSGGTVTCFEDCTVNYFACDDPPVTGCGNNTVDPGEECDDGNHANDDGCSNDCRIISATCGDGNVDTGEECDEPATSTLCSDLGLGTEGVAFCNPDTCFMNTSYCSFGNMQQISLQIDIDPGPEDDLSPESLATIEALKAAGYTRSCNGVQSVQDGWLIDGVPDNCYCTARVLENGTHNRGFFVFHTPTDSLGNRQPVLRIYPNGETRTEYGAWLSKWDGLKVQMVVAVEEGPRLMLTPALKAEKAMRYVGSFTDSQGNIVTRASLGFKVNGGQLGLRLPGMETTQAIQVSKMTEEVFLPLDPDQLAAWFEDWQPPTVKKPKDKGCNTSGSPLNNPLPTFIVLSMLLMLAIRRRRK